MSDENMTRPTAESLERLAQSAGAQLTWVVAKVLVTAFVSSSIALGVGYMRDVRNEVVRVGQQLTRQDKAQALTDQRVSDLKQVSDATVTSVQQIGQQVTRNSVAIQDLRTDESRRGRR